MIILFTLIPLFAQTSGKCVEGDCVNGIGTMEYKSLGTYVGKFKNSKREGSGVFSYLNGDVFEGTYKNDLRSGFHGMFTFSNGDQFTGNFINDIGKGKLIDADENEIPGKLDAANHFVEDRIAFGNLTAKLKKSVVYLDSIIIGNNRRFVNASGIMIARDKFIVFDWTIPEGGLTNLKFSNGTKLNRVVIEKISGESTSPYSVFGFTASGVPSSVVPIEMNYVAPRRSMKIISICQSDFNVQEGNYTEHPTAPFTGPVAGNGPAIDPVVKVVFDRSGRFFGFVRMANFEDNFAFLIGERRYNEIVGLL